MPLSLAFVYLCVPLRLPLRSSAFVLPSIGAVPKTSGKEPEAVREAIDSIAVAAPQIYFSRFQPKNRMSSPKTI
jgi:hypothetical protein